MALRKSIIQVIHQCRHPKCCRTQGLISHEVFYGTANRKKSIEDGMVIYLCNEHHNMSNEAIHSDHEWDLQEKKKAQMIWEMTYGDRDAFRKRYGRSYL